MTQEGRRCAATQFTPLWRLQVSDILHNTTAPVRNASRYRSRLEEQLPDIFESLQVGACSDLRSTWVVLKNGGVMGCVLVGG